MSAAFLRRIGGYAAMITAVTLAAFLWGLRSGDEGRAVTLAFMTLALAQILHLGNARRAGAVLDPASALSNRWALLAVAFTVSLQLLAVYWSPLAALLELRPPALGDWAVVAPLALFPALAGQLAKLGSAARTGRSSPSTSA